MPPTDLVLAIDEIRLVDTHEHLRSEREWVENGPDILQDLFGIFYAEADLLVAGAAPDAVTRLLDPSDADIEGRFAGIRDAWEAMQHTGYGEAVRLIASEIYGLEALTPDGLRRADETLSELRRPGERLRLLSETARLDHVQIDHGEWAPPEDHSFFLYDISWARFCSGAVEPEAILGATGVELRTLEDLRHAMSAIFARSAPRSIAVKAQHAYDRTLHWEERSDDDAARALAAVLAGNDDEAARLILGDWCWARGVELAIEHDLPFKLHTGYLAAAGGRWGADWVDRVRAGNLSALLGRYPEARFVLMHIAYPYQDELVALAKQYPNVWWTSVGRGQSIRTAPGTSCVAPSTPSPSASCSRSAATPSGRRTPSPTRSTHGAGWRARSRPRSPPGI